jgi:hypothetical protein
MGNTSEYQEATINGHLYVYEPAGSIIRLQFIRNIDDEECIA